MTDTSWDILIRKLDSLEEKIDRLEEFVGIVKRHSYPIPGTIPQVDPSYWQTEPFWGDRDLGKDGSITSPCAFDSLPPEDRMKFISIFCGCSKCSPQCMTNSSIMNTPMQWGCTDDTITSEKLLGKTK